MPLCENHLYFSSEFLEIGAQLVFPGTTYSLVQLYMPGVTAALCNMYDVVSYEVTSPGCKEKTLFKRCVRQGKSSYWDSCDYKCVCQGAQCGAMVAVKRDDYNQGLNQICEVCVLEF